MLNFKQRRMVIILIWLCLITINHCQHVDRKVITVDNSGDDSILCCAFGYRYNCSCNSLYYALSYITNNTVINITSPAVSLHNYVYIENANDIIITSSVGATVMCNNTGYVLCTLCFDATIEGIIWDQCGDISIPFIPGIFFNSSANILIINCTFQQFKVCVAVEMSSALGSINVVNSKFIFNSISNASVCGTYSTLLLTPNYYYYYSMHVNITIYNSLFYYNGYSDQGSALLSDSGALHVPFTIQPVFILLENTSFVSNGIKSINILCTTVRSKTIFDKVNVSDNEYGIYAILAGNLDVISSHLTHNKNGALHLWIQEQKVNIKLYNTTFSNNNGTRSTFGSALYIITTIKDSINISLCSFYDNFGGNSVVYITSYFVEYDFLTVVTNVLITSCNFVNNNEPALQVAQCFLKFFSSTLFQGNSAKSGAAIYIAQTSQITVDDGSTVQFINNTASLRGGAMYIDLTNCYDRGIVFTNFTRYDAICFTDNLAKLSGNSIYFNIPASCNVVRDYTSNHSAAYIPFKFTYKCNESHKITGSEIATSPYGIKLCSPELTNSMIDSNDKYQVNNEQSNSTENKCVNDTGKIGMLGHPIYFSTTMYDYFNCAAETIMFQVKCDNCESEFKLIGNRTLVHNELPVKVKFLSDKELKNDTDITLTLTSLLPLDYRQLTATLSLTLSPCFNGFSFSNQSQQCECYNADSKLMQCREDTARIKLGYWFGDFNNVHTLSLCYQEYCNFFSELYRNETGNGFFILPREEDDQCNSHRTGVACGECSKGYTLAFNSPDCISVDKCSPGMTVLVIVLTALYWVAIVAILFGVAYSFNTQQVSLGYLYGMIYFYSIVDILLLTNLQKTDGVFYTAAILSSFAKLNPQFLGKLCLIKNLDAIDQQFIHYCHVVFISIILIGIVIVSKCNKRAFFYIKHLMVPVTCLLLLFSYTSLTSTSLLLLIPVKLNGEGHTFLSPREKYFHNQHVAYAIVAIFCVLIVTIGFPLLLVIEPFMTKILDGYLNMHVSKKSLQIKNFMKKNIIVRIKPLLDRLQDCYKDKYRWFAAYYLICRLVIMLITYFANDDYNNMIYYLQTACVVITMTHIWIQPYKNDILNVMDAIILLIMLLIVNLSAIEFSTSTIAGVAIILIIAPLFLLFGVAFKKVCLPKIKKFLSNPDSIELTSISRNVTPSERYCELQESLLMFDSETLKSTK